MTIARSLTGGFDGCDVITSAYGVYQFVGTTTGEVLNDLGNFISAGLTLAADATTHCPQGPCGAVFTTPVQVVDTQDEVPYANAEPGSGQLEGRWWSGHNPSPVGADELSDDDN